MPPKFSKASGRVRLKEKVICHLCAKTMRFDVLRDSHFPNVHKQPYKRPLDKGQSLLSNAFQKSQRTSENQSVSDTESHQRCASMSDPEIDKELETLGESPNESFENIVRPKSATYETNTYFDIDRPLSAPAHFGPQFFLSKMSPL